MSDTQNDLTDIEAPTEEEIEQAYADYVPSKPLPAEHELDDAECHNCGEPWDEDEWDERHTHGGPALGEDWHYTCPGCGEETFTVGT